MPVDRDQINVFMSVVEVRDGTVSRPVFSCDRLLPIRFAQQPQPWEPWIGIVLGHDRDSVHRRLLSGMDADMLHS